MRGQLEIHLMQYEKDIRKQICEEIKVALRQKVTKMKDDVHCYPQNVVHWQDVVAILDQILEDRQ